MVSMQLIVNYESAFYHEKQFRNNATGVLEPRSSAHHAVDHVYCLNSAFARQIHLLREKSNIFL